MRARIGDRSGALLVFPPTKWFVAALTACAAFASGSPAVARQVGPPSECAPGWESTFPPAGTVYIDPLTGCTGVYETVHHDPVYIADREDITTDLVFNPIFPNGTCQTCSWSVNHSVTDCDSYTISGAATAGATVGSGLEAEADAVFVKAKMQMQVAYTAQFTLSGGFEGQTCEEWGWSSTIPGPPCTKIEFRGYKATQPTWALSSVLSEVRVRFVGECAVNGGFAIHHCLRTTRADLHGEQCPADGAGAGWRVAGVVEGCDCPGGEDGTCLEQSRVFVVMPTRGAVTLRLSIEQLIRGLPLDCDFNWVDGWMSGAEPTAQIDATAE